METTCHTSRAASSRSVPARVAVTADDWAAALKEDENVARHALAFATRMMRADPSLLESVVKSVWLPTIANPRTHPHVQCLLLDSIRIAVTKGQAIASKCPHPFLFLTHTSYQPPVIEEGGTHGYDGTAWIERHVGEQHTLSGGALSCHDTTAPSGSLSLSLSPERRKQSVAQLHTLTSLGLSTPTHEQTLQCIQSLFRARWSEPSVLHHAELLLSAMDRALANPLQAVVMALERLRLLFPNYQKANLMSPQAPATNATGGTSAATVTTTNTNDAKKDAKDESDWDATSSESESDWDASSSSSSDSDDGAGGGQGSLLVAGISAKDEIARARRLLRLYDQRYGYGTAGGDMGGSGGHYGAGGHPFTLSHGHRATLLEGVQQQEGAGGVSSSTLSLSLQTAGYRSSSYSSYYLSHISLISPADAADIEYLRSHEDGSN